MDTTMKARLGLYSVALLALVAASTTVLVKPELIGGSAHATVAAIGSIPALGHH
jgi:hypothetical protein